jgi:hypothetical protein
MIDYKKLNNEQIKTINNVMDNFDFERVEKVMDCLEWSWGVGHDEHVPDIYEIKQFARHLLADTIIRLSHLIENKSLSLSTGGFVATSYRDGSLSLSFVVEEWGYSIEEDI